MMKRAIDPLRIATCALLAATAFSQSPPTVVSPFFGTFGAGSPELSTYSWTTADIVRRVPSSSTPNAPALRGDASLLMPPYPKSSIELASIGYFNDVFPAWGPWSQLPPAVGVRRSTVGYTVSPGTVVNDPSTGLPVVTACPSNTVSAELFWTEVRATAVSGGQTYTATIPTASTCGMSSSSSTGTVLSTLAIEPGNATNCGHPVLFTLTRTSCSLLNGSGPTIFRPCDIWFSDGNGTYFPVFEGDTAAGLNPNDSIDAFAVSNAGYSVFSLDPASPTVLAANVTVTAAYPNAVGTVSCASQIINQNTLIGFVPASAATLQPGLALPNVTGCPTYGWGVPFLWFDPALLGLDPNTSTSDNLNGLEIRDPPSDGLSGSMDLRGADGQMPQDRLRLLARTDFSLPGVAGDGGGVVPIPLVEWQPVQIEILMGGYPLPTTSSSTPPTSWGWALLLNVGRASEFTWMPYSIPGVSNFALFFDWAASTTFAVTGTLPTYLLPTPSQSYVPGPAPADDHIVSILGGLPAGSYTMQLFTLFQMPTGVAPQFVVETSNCIELDVTPAGQSAAPLK